ncbi:MAG: YkvA family protein [cyanobacterium endosymbiont of Rhopalodia fuxianensis]
MKRPQSRRLIILGTLIYVLSPIDISPDLIPILGWIDDGLLIFLAYFGNTVKNVIMIKLFMTILPA